MRARLAGVYRRHGFTGLARRLAGRIWRRRAYVLFEMACSDAVAQPPWTDSAVTLRLVDNADLQDTAALVAAASGMDADVVDYFDDVRSGRAVAVIGHAGPQVVHYAFLFKHNRTACLLGLPAGAALIGNAYTAPAYRGRGLQGASVRLRASAAKASGFERVFAETSPDNLASQRGMQRGGMRPIGRLTLAVLLGAIVVRWRRPSGFRLFGLCH